MKRKTFLQNSIVAGLGISLCPQFVFAEGRRTNRLFDLPDCGKQIRHGNLYASLNRSGRKTVFEWLLNFEKQVFFKNGFTPGDGDLTHISLRLEGLSEPVNFGLVGNEVFHFQLNEVKKQKLSFNKLSEIFQQGNYSVRVGFCDECLTLSRKSKNPEIVFINLKSGNFMLNEQTVLSNQGVLSSADKISVKPLEENAVFLGIERKA